MSVIDLILLSVVLISALVLFTVFFRKTEVLRTVDVSAIQRDRNNLVTADLIAARLSRKLLTATRWIGLAAGPALTATRGGYKRLVERVETLEREYRIRATQQHISTTPETNTKIQALLDEGRDWMKAQEWEKAEQKFIEVISLSSTNADAFLGLGEICLEKRDYHHAKESLKHAAKLAPRNTSIYLDLVAVYRLSGHHHKSLDFARRAVALEPNDPKCLHAMLVSSIAAGNKRLALTALSQLETANPENQKLPDYRKEVADMPSR